MPEIHTSRRIGKFDRVEYGRLVLWKTPEEGIHDDDATAPDHSGPTAYVASEPRAGLWFGLGVFLLLAFA